MKSWIVILAALLGGLLYLLNKQFPYVLDGQQAYLGLIQILAMLALIVFGLTRHNISKELVIKSLAGWMGIALIGLSIYNYQWELKEYFYKIFGRLVPSIGQVNKDGSVTFYAGDNDHFMIDAKVNGQVVHFLLDTGASKVTLGAQDARRIGVDIDALKYDIRVQTAKGVNFVAYVKFDSIQVGDILVKNIDGYVVREGLSGSLLGMNFLNRLSRYEVGKGSITLWEN